jgi:hypothetical protein
MQSVLSTSSSRVFLPSKRVTGFFGFIFYLLNCLRLLVGERVGWLSLVVLGYDLI